MIEMTIEYPGRISDTMYSGSSNSFAKKIERALHVTLIPRGDTVKILGTEPQAKKAKSVLEQLTALAERGNEILEQNVDYTLSLAMEDQEEQVLEIDRDMICQTIQGKPVKPKNAGNRKNMVGMRIRE